MARIDTNRVKIAPPGRKASSSSGIDEKIYTALSLLIGAIALVGIGYTIFYGAGGKDDGNVRKSWDLTPPKAPEKHSLGSR